VHFAGWQPNVAELMAAADIVVLPSRWEGMPNVVLEAMAAGKPIVATQAEGTVELLGLGALDQTVAIDDSHGMRTRIASIVSDAKLAADLGRKNQERAKLFSIENAVERYQRLYRSLLDR
jgi:glycosyltransferase involved in cell wall biosynthesis